MACLLAEITAELCHYLLLLFFLKLETWTMNSDDKRVQKIKAKVAVKEGTLALRFIPSPKTVRLPKATATGAPTEPLDFGIDLIGLTVLTVHWSESLR